MNRWRSILHISLVASVLASLLVSLPSIARAEPDLASDLAAAIATESAPVTGASFVTITDQGTPAAVSDTAFAAFPSDGSSYAILTTGDATQADDAPQSNFASVSNNGGHRPGEDDANPTDFDVTILKIDLEVPSEANCLSFQFRFLSEEFPEFVNSSFNDAFIAEWGANTWSTNGSAISAPDNFAFDDDNQIVSVNSSGLTRMTAAEAEGTIYDGATAALLAQTPVSEGSHSLYLSVFDQGDHIYDSAVFVDALTLGTASEGGCVEGVQPLANLSVEVNPSQAPAGFAEIPMADLDYAALSASGSGEEAALATSPINHGPINHGPINHDPINHGPINHGPIIGQDTAFRQVPLSALPLDKVPPILISSVPILSPPGPWSSALPDELSALPFQTVTLQQFAVTPNPDPNADAVYLGDLDLKSTTFGSVSPASLLFGKATLGALGLIPPNGYSNGNILIELELGGASLSSLDIQEIILVDEKADLAGTPLGSMSLDQVDWGSAPEWNLKVGDIPQTERGLIVDCFYIDCLNPGTTTLGDAADTGDVNHTATLEKLLNLSNAASLLAGKTFGELLPAIVNVENFPFGDVSLDSILAASPLNGPFVTYTAGADVACPIEGATFQVNLPGPGARYAPGTGSFDLGGEGPPTPAEPTTSGDQLTFTLPSDSCESGSKHVGLTYQVEPGPRLGVFTTSLHVTAGEDTLAALDQAPLTTTENFETNDTPGQATQAAEGTLYTETISAADDVDYFALPVTQEDVGRMVQVSMTHLPGVDLDVLLYGAATASTLRGAPINHGPINHGPLLDDGQCLPPGTELESQTLQDVPVLNSTEYTVRAFSTNRSTTEEFACTIVQPEDAGGSILIQVNNFLAGSSNQPALLGVDMSGPAQPLTCFDIPAGAGNPGPSLPALGSLATDTQTLFLVNAEAIGRFYGTAAESDVLAALTDSSFLSMTNVKGVVLSVDRNANVAEAYSSWYGDTGEEDADNYCSPGKANDVVRAINDLVDAYRETGPGLPNLKNIVPVGADAVLPHARIQEMVNLGSEATEAANVQFDGLDNPTSRALSLGYMLSDDPYYSFQPTPWVNTDLYPPSVAGGRLVEKPAEIVSAIAKYKSFGGVLDPKTEYTTGYDFFQESSQAQDDIFHGPLAYPKLNGQTKLSQINDGWTKTHLSEAIDAAPGIAVVNAHADHYRLAPADAYNNNSPDLYETNDLLSSSLSSGTLAFSIGCHAGLSVADVWVSGPDPAALDWAQAFAQKDGVFSGNTGFGYGDSKTTAYSERLTLLLSENLDGTMSIGQAVAYAKQQYYAGLGAWGVFDVKSVEEFTPYGLPMYVVGPNGSVAGPVPPSSPPDIAPDPDGTGLATAHKSFASLNSGAVDTGEGVYYKGPSGATLAEHYRAIQPVTDPVDVTPSPGSGLRLHGALVLAFAKTDIPSFEAALSVPTLARSVDQPQPAVRDEVFPSSLVAPLSQDTIFGRRDSIVMVGGQFISDRSGQPNTGTQRLISNSDLRLYYHSDDDFSVAQFSSIAAEDQGAVAAFAMTTSSDQVVAAYVTYRLAGSNHFQSKKMALDGDTWKATVDTSQHKVAEYMVQMVTNKGNVSVSNNKQLTFSSPKPGGGGSTTVDFTDGSGNPVSPNEFGWFNKSPIKVSITTTTGLPIQAKLDGGNFEPVTGPITVSGEGMHEIVYQVGDEAEEKIEVPIDTLKPTISPCPSTPTHFLNGEGGSVPLEVTASDPGFPGDPATGSGVNEEGSVLTATLNTTSVGTKSISFSAQDYAGNAQPRLCTYSVQYNFSGFFAPIDNPNAVNSAKAGQTIPVRWRLTDANGVGISDPASFVSLATTLGGNCGGGSDPIETYSGQSGLQYLGNGNWQYNWKTPKSYAGQCRTMILNLNDGVVPAGGQPRTAFFKFT